MKKIAILGSTGSIGTQALDIIDKNRDKYKVTALSCATRIRELTEQIEKFSPEIVSVEKEEDALVIANKFPKVHVFFGKEGLNAIAESECDILLNSLMGMRGLEPTYKALVKGTDIAFANKETLVSGGDIIMQAAKKSGAKLLPVDSEHSAIFQSLQGNKGQNVKRILLTASGGPFRNWNHEQLKTVTLEMALKHPNWSMGQKITIDSATMMNKGLEVIEAKWLFDVPAEKIEVLVHPQSIIHSMVEYEDTSIIAQLGMPDMRVPISYAFAYPDRLPLSELISVDFFTKASNLTFEKPDLKTFRCLGLAYEAIKLGSGYPVVMNAANEVLVDAFLKKRIGFIDIQENIERVMENYKGGIITSVDEIIALDKDSRDYTNKLLKGNI